MKIPQERSDGGIGAIPAGYVKENMPDLIVSYDIFAESLKKDEVMSKYNIIRIPAYLPQDLIYSQGKQLWTSNYIRIYIRKGLPVSKLISSYRR